MAEENIVFPAVVDRGWDGIGAVMVDAGMVRGTAAAAAGPVCSPTQRTDNVD